MKSNLCTFDAYNMQTNEKVFKTLNSVATDTDHIPVVYGFDSYNLCLTGEIGRTLATPSGGLNEHIPVVILNDQGGDVMNMSEDVTSTLRAQDHGHPPVVCFEPGILSRDCSAGNRAYENICSTLRAQMGDNQPAVCFQQNQREEVRDMGEIAGALTAESGMHNTNYICYTMNERQISMMVQENKANTIAATDYKGVQILCYEENNGKD